MSYLNQDYRWIYRLIFIVWLAIFVLHANNVYFFDIREFPALSWTGFAADTKEMSNSVLYRSFSGGYGEQLLLSLFIFLLCLPLLALLILRRALVAFFSISYQVESGTAMFVVFILTVTYLIPILFPTHYIFYSATGTRMSGLPHWLKLFMITVGWPALTVMLIDLNLNPKRSWKLQGRLSQK